MPPNNMHNNSYLLNAYNESSEENDNQFTKMFY